MGKIKNIFFSALLFVSAVLRAQTPPGYVLEKTIISTETSNPETVVFQWIASNNTSQSGNFFILENLPNHYVIQSIAGGASLPTAPAFNPSLPLLGPSALTIGPFPIAANSSVTFQVIENIQEGQARGQNQSISGETFSLVSQSQLAGKNPESLITGLSANRSGTPTPNATNSSAGNLIQSVIAAPNISNGNQPINFVLNLTSPAVVNLSLFTVVGERVFDAQAEEAQGASTIVWNTQNNTHQSVASGLYIYLLRVDGAGIEETRVGKVLVIH